VLRDEAILADVAAARRTEPEALHLWWLGQSGFLAARGERLVVLDPYLSDSLTRKYAASEHPHVRMTARVVDPGRLADVDLVTASHGHTDHLDGETLGPLLAASPAARLVVPEAIRGLAVDRLGLADAAWPVGLDDGETTEVAGITVTGVAAAHETVERDAEGRCRFLGYVVRIGPFSLFHGGDTLLHDGLAAAVRPHRVDVALLPVNGRDPARGVAGNLDGEEAALLAREADASLAVPCHYEMFTFNTAPPDAFAAACERLGVPFRVLRAGERATISEPRSR
jgi:L-ascorbate metabolism protein UlaG (beta-lactamase superfamily)